MKSKDLMIGDWVIRKGVPEEPMRLYDMKVSAGIAYLDQDGRGVTEKFENIEPIPLTPEILEKNGFEKCGNHSWHNEILRQIYVRIVCLPEKDRDLHSSIWRFDFPCVVSAGADDVFFRCDYVHELQHVLKLCRIEKEIIL